MVLRRCRTPSRLCPAIRSRVALRFFIGTREPTSGWPESWRPTEPTLVTSGDKTRDTFFVSRVFLRCRLWTEQALPTGVVNGVVFRINQFAYGNHGVAALMHEFQDGGQGLRGVEGGVVEEDDGPGAHVPCHPLGDGGRVIILPVQAVPAGSGCKGLGEGKSG